GGRRRRAGRGARLRRRARPGSRAGVPRAPVRDFSLALLHVGEALGDQVLHVLAGVGGLGAEGLGDLVPAGGFVGVAEAAGAFGGEIAEERALALGDVLAGGERDAEAIEGALQVLLLEGDALPIAGDQVGERRAGL